MKTSFAATASIIILTRIEPTFVFSFFALCIFSILIQDFKNYINNIIRQIL